jgi:hypothetical protein
MRRERPYAAWFELDRARLCPRPDKQWWHTLEAADQILTRMRATDLLLNEVGKIHVRAAEDVPTGGQGFLVLVAARRRSTAWLTRSFGSPGVSARREVVGCDGM